MTYEDRQAAKKERLENAAERARKESKSAYDSAKTKASHIPFGQPILVGHHSEGRDRNYRASIHRGFSKSFALQDKADYLEARAAAVGTGGISSDDPEAINKLTEQLTELESKHEKMKKINVFIRKNDQPGIEALGYTQEQAAQFFNKDFAGRIGIPSYRLTNNLANIHRIKDRINQLKKNAERVATTKTGNGYEYKICNIENRVMFFFDGKPSEEVRNILKRYAFKFSPSRNKAWVRQLNNAGIYAGKEVCAKLDSLT